MPRYSYIDCLLGCNDPLELLKVELVAYARLTGTHRFRHAAAGLIFAPKARAVAAHRIEDGVALRFRTGEGRHLTRDWVIRPMISDEIGIVVDLLSTVPAADIRFALRNSLAESNGNGNAGYAVVAGLAGEIVAAAAVTADHAFPGAMLANLVVKPGYRRRGIATSMAGALARSLRGSTSADTVTTSIRDDLPIGRSFAERRGFTLASHSIGFRYDLPDGADELASLAYLAARRAHVRVRQMPMDTAADRIADCFRRCRSGLPLRYGQRPFDVEARLREYPPDTVYLLAERLSEHEAHPIAMTVLFPRSDGEPWYTKFTGTDPQFRGRGAARAVKTAALHLAFQAGAPAVTTHNNECNSPILSLNEKLGTKRDVGYWAMTRPL
jgi:GNAT superfamily N-acetyltransferase